MKRVTFSIGDGVDESIRYVSKRLGISRSALVSNLLDGSVTHMKDMLLRIPEDATSLSGSDVKRMRGISAGIVKDQIQALKDFDDDLFSDL